MLEEAKRQQIVNEARSWMGTPYHHAGRAKGFGVDCGQILAAVYEAAGLIPHVEPEPYPHDWHLHRSEERYLHLVQSYAVPTDTPKPGDIALFKWGRCIAHGAIVVEWPRVIHSTLQLGVVEEDAEANADLKKRLAGWWTLWRSES